MTAPAPRVYLMTGPWENDPEGKNPGVYMDDPDGGDPRCLATIKRLINPGPIRDVMIAGNAAPKLVEALQNMLRDWPGRESEITDAARAAIAEAEGRS